MIASDPIWSAGMFLLMYLRTSVDIILILIILVSRRYVLMGSLHDVRCCFYWKRDWSHDAKLTLISV